MAIAARFGLLTASVALILYFLDPDLGNFSVILYAGLAVLSAFLLSRKDKFEAVDPHNKAVLITVIFKMAIAARLGLLTASVALVLYFLDPDLGDLSWIIYAGLAVLSAFLLLRKDKFVAVNPENKAVLITGCDSGFGNQLAHRLDELGYTVFAGCLFSDREGAQHLQKETSERLVVVQCDVTDDWQVRGAVKKVKEVTKERGLELWAVVNNAGVAMFTEIEWCSVTQFQRIMDVNVFGVVRVTKAFLPLVRETSGRIINVASLAGRFTVPAFAAYSMSKRACIAFSDALRQEMAKFGVKVITIEPGLYKTPIAETQSLIATNKKSWSETPTEVKEVYGEEYFDAFLINITSQMKRARSNVNEVVDLMVQAVCAENPKIRYVPYWRSNIRATILSYLPASVTDKLFGAYMPKKKPKLSRSTSRSSTESDSK